MRIYAQNEIIMENVIENMGQDVQYSAPELDLIEYHRDNPINLFNTSANELATLPGISVIDARKIIEFVDNYPQITNRRLADSVGLTAEVEILLDVCTIRIKEKKSNNSYRINHRSRAKYRFDDIKGIEEGKYLGSNDDIYNRFLLNYSDYEAGATINKHAGEVYYDEFNSAFLRYDDGANQITIGDFYADYGMGALLWRQFSMRKGSNVISPVINMGTGIAPYRSSIDFGHFRGFAAQSNIKLSESNFLRISGFYSNRDKSATLDSSLMEVTSVYLSGYYRTESEIEKKGILNEEALGVNLEFKNLNGISIGFTALNLDYNHPISSEAAGAFSGQNGTLLSAYSMYSAGKNAIGLETALDANQNKLLRLAYIYSSKSFDFGLSGRYIDSKFRSPYGYSFGEFSYPANEQGIYSSFQLKLSSSLSIALFSDIFSTIDRTYTVPGRVKGMDLFAEVNYKFDRNNFFSLRLRRDSKGDVFSLENGSRIIADGIKKSIRIDYTSNLNKELRVRIRTELSDYANEYGVGNGAGIMSFIECKWQPVSSIKFGARYTVFSTDNFNSAIYQYEYNVPGTMLSTALFGKGSRIILTMEIMPFDFLKIYALYTSSSKNNINNLGTGNEMLPSNLDNRATLQFELNIK